MIGLPPQGGKKQHQSAAYLVLSGRKFGSAGIFEK
jgi:hypothetical protein